MPQDDVPKHITSVAQTREGKPFSKSLPHRDLECDHNASASSINEQQPTFMRLPSEIKRRILEFLLQAEQVHVQTFPDISRKPYRYDTAILRTCKALKDIGMEVFNQNDFILVSTNDPNMYNEMSAHDICLWNNKHSYFQGYHLRLHITASGIPPPKVNHFFLLCAADLTGFVAVLRIGTYVADRKFNVKMEIKGFGGGDESLSPKRQLTILAPFFSLHARGQRCFIKGLVDADLATNLRDAMTSPVYWVRAELRSRYKLLNFLRQLADGAFGKREFTQACKLYSHAGMFSECTSYMDQVSFFLNDVDVSAALQFLSNCLQMSTERATIWWAMTKIFSKPEKVDAVLQALLVLPIELGNTSAKGRSKFLRVRGIASILRGKVQQAQDFFEQAREVFPSYEYNDAYSREIPALTRATSMLGIRHDLAMLVSVAKRLAENTLAKPFSQPIKITHASIAALDQELYDLKALGYRGDWLESQVAQKADYCVRNGHEALGIFDPNSRNEVLRPILKTIKRCKESGVQPPDVEIEQPWVWCDKIEQVMGYSGVFRESIEKGLWVVDRSNESRSVGHGTLAQREGASDLVFGGRVRQRDMLRALQNI